MARQEDADSFGDHFARQQQHRDRRRSVHRQYFGTIHQSYSVILPCWSAYNSKTEQGLRTRILLLRLITWIGRWSMLDLFVILINHVVDKPRSLLAFTMAGPAAVYFGGAVILTILAVEWLDSRLLLGRS